MTGNPIKKALNIGTVPLVNQMNANKIIAITGVALQITNKGVKKDFMNGKNPLNNPKKVETETIIIKLIPPRTSVVETFSQNVGLFTILINASSVSIGEGSKTGMFSNFAPMYQDNRSNRVETTTMSLFFQIEIFIRYRGTY